MFSCDINWSSNCQLRRFDSFPSGFFFCLKSETFFSVFNFLFLVVGPFLATKNAGIGAVAPRPSYKIAIDDKSKVN